MSKSECTRYRLQRSLDSLEFQTRMGATGMGQIGFLSQRYLPFSGLWVAFFDQAMARKKVKNFWDENRIIPKVI